MNQQGPTEIFILWFRNTLRLHDLQLLQKISKLPRRSCFLPIFIISPRTLNHSLVGPNPAGFLLQALDDLNTNIQRNYQNRLLVMKGNYIDCMKCLIDHLRKIYGETLKSISLGWELYSDPQRRDIDEAMSRFCKLHHAKPVNVGHSTLWEIPLTLKANKGLVPNSMCSFLQLRESLPIPSHPIKPPDALPRPPKDFFISFFKELPFCSNIGLSSNVIKVSMIPAVTIYLEVPSLKQLDPEYIISDRQTFFYGGESKALNILDILLENRRQNLKYREPQPNPTSLVPEPSCLSPYLRFGCLSPRLYYHRLLDIYGGKALAVKTKDSLLWKLYWREFFYLIGYNSQRFPKINGNPLCKQIEWDYNQDYVQAWESGRTGFPSIGIFYFYARFQVPTLKSKTFWFKFKKIFVI